MDDGSDYYGVKGRAFQMEGNERDPRLQGLSWYFEELIP